MQVNLLFRRKMKCPSIASLFHYDFRFGTDNLRTFRICTWKGTFLWTVNLVFSRLLLWVCVMQLCGSLFTTRYSSSFEKVYVGYISWGSSSVWDRERGKEIDRRMMWRERKGRIMMPWLVYLWGFREWLAMSNLDTTIVCMCGFLLRIKENVQLLEYKRTYWDFVKVTSAYLPSFPAMLSLRESHHQQDEESLDILSFSFWWWRMWAVCDGKLYVSWVLELETRVDWCECNVWSVWTLPSGVSPSRLEREG